MGENEYDVIVVGAGPAGCAAAKVASERGMRTILLEEHTWIGIPRHCTGMLHGTKSGLGEKTLSTMDKRVILGEARLERMFSPKGRLLEVSLKGTGVYLIDRALFDMELAVQAANAGAEILLNTRATGLLKDGERVSGVTTNSSTVPELRSKIVIGADGILKSQLGGIAKWSSLVEPKLETLTAITWWLAGVKGLEPCVIERHLGPFGGKRGWVFMSRGNGPVCTADFISFQDLEQCRRGESVLSERIKEAQPVRLTGWTHPLYIKPLKDKVSSGLILAGAAGGFHQSIMCLKSGLYAGEVAAEAIIGNNVSKEKLDNYNKICESIKDGRDMDFSTFGNKSESEQEQIFESFCSLKDINLEVFDF